MKALITGISGFVGHHLLRELKARNIDVYGLDILSSSTEGVITADIMDRKKLEGVVSEISPDCIIHLAAISSVDHEKVSAIYEVNFNGTVNLLSACINARKKPRFIYISSSLVYGSVSAADLPIDESFTVNPINHYGAGKAASEMAVKAFGAEYDIPYTIVRPFNHTGPGQSDRFVVPKIINAFKRGDDTIELGNIDIVRDFTDVRDIVKAYAALNENFKNGETYNISSGRGVSIHDIFEMLKSITGHDMKIIKKEYYVRKNEIRSVVGNADKLGKDTGWKPEITLEKTLRDMLKS